MSNKPHAFVRAVIAFAAVLALANTATAFAHAKIKTRTPNPGASLTAGPRTVAIGFAERVLAGKLTVTRSGTTVLRGVLDKSSGRRISARAAIPLPTGIYKVTWRAKANDGDSMSGSWSFRVR